MISSNRRIVKNSIFLLSRTIFLTLVTLYTLREVVSILGTEEFGLYTVVFGVVAMFAFINSAMMSATQRFLSIAIGKNQIKEIRNNFYGSLFIHIGLAILVAILIFLSKDYFLYGILNIDAYKKEATIIYYFALCSVFISFIQVPFSALITAYEKMQAFAYLAIFEGVAKLVVVYLLTFFDYNKVVMYSLFLTIISILILFLHILYCYVNFKHLIDNNLKLKKINLMIKGMVNFIGWSLIGNLSVVLRNQGSSILINVYFGLAVNAAFAISLTVMSAVGAIISSITNAINPQIFKAYAEGNIDKYYMLISKGTKYYIYLLSLVIIPLIFFMEYIMKLWMRDYPENTVLFCQLILIVLLIDAFSILLTSGIQANGRIKWNQIVTGTLLCLPLPITYFLYDNFYSINSIFYIFIVVSILSLFTKLYFMSILVRYSIISYFRNVLYPGFFIVMINSVIMFGLINFFGFPDRFMDFIISLVTFVFLSSFFTFIFGVNFEEKMKLKKYFMGKVKI